ncbi:MAG: GAF domain-containing protein [Myxococcota bacterium]|nr:GAF domain-containing protein [Myxococcota bacterium]
MSTLHRHLVNALEQCGAGAGTIHERSGAILRLKAAHGIPESTLSLIQEIPHGKGMAGQAWAQQQPVSTCNLREDPHASIQPGARDVDAQRAIAFPINDPAGQVQFVIGFAFAHGASTKPRVSDEELRAAAEHLATIGRQGQT